MMDVLTSFHFIRPWWSVLILVALALWWFERREADTTVRWRAVTRISASVLACGAPAACA